MTQMHGLTDRPGRLHALILHLQTAAIGLLTLTTAAPGLTAPRPPPPTPLDNNNETFAELGSAGSHVRNLPNLFVPVKCVRALMNCHRFIPLPHRRYCHYAPSLRFYTPSHTFHFAAVLLKRAIKSTTPPLNTHKPRNNEKPLAE